MYARKVCDRIYYDLLPTYTRMNSKYTFRIFYASVVLRLLYIAFVDQSLIFDYDFMAVLVADVAVFTFVDYYKS